MKLKYPRISCELDRRFKLCNKDVKKIITLRNKGKTYKFISKKFKVNSGTIWRVVNQNKNKKYIKAMCETNKKRYAESEEFRNYTKENTRKNQKIRRSQNKKLRDWESVYKKEWAKNNPEKIKKYRKDYNQKKKLKILQLIVKVNKI